MIASQLMDFIIGLGSFGGASGIGLMTKAITNSKEKSDTVLKALTTLGGGPKTEEDKQRTHELALKKLDLDYKLLHNKETMTYKDIGSARKMQSRFVGITRRGLAWSTLFLLFMLGIMGLISVLKGGMPSVSIPISATHSALFGLFKWTTHGSQQLIGMVWLPWFQMWFFMIGGFYFGREATK